MILAWIESKRFLIEHKQFKTIPKTIKLKKVFSFFNSSYLSISNIFAVTRINICFFEKCHLKFQWLLKICELSTYLLHNNVHFFFTKKHTNFQNIFFHQKKLPTVIKKIAPIQYLKLRFVKMFSYITLFFNINIKKFTAIVHIF